MADVESEDSFLNSETLKRNLSALSTPDGNPKSGKTSRPGGSSSSYMQDELLTEIPAPDFSNMSFGMGDILGNMGGAPPGATSPMLATSSLTIEEQKLERMFERLYPRILYKMINDEKAKDVVGLAFKAYLDQLKNEISALASEIRGMKDNEKKRDLELEDCRAEVNKLAFQLDSVDQHRRRKTLKIYGVPEKPGESTRTITVDLAEKLGIDMSRDDIKRSHRTGQKGTAKPRPISVKFNEIEDKRRVYKSRTKFRKPPLEDKSYDGIPLKDIYFNEDLAPERNQLLYKCRLLCGSKLLFSSWSFEGMLYVKTTKEGQPIQIKKLADLDPFKNSVFGDYNPSAGMDEDLNPRVPT